MCEAVIKGSVEVIDLPLVVVQQSFQFLPSQTLIFQLVCQLVYCSANIEQITPTAAVIE